MRGEFENLRWMWASPNPKRNYGGVVLWIVGDVDEVNRHCEEFD